MELFKKNMIVMRGCSPKAAAWVACTAPDPRFEIVDDPDGRPNLAFRDDSGCECLLYKPEDDDRIPVVREYAEKSSPNGATIVFGFGLGRMASTLLKFKPAGHTLFVVEEHPDLIRESFRLDDYAGHMAGDGMVFLSPEEEGLKKLAAQMALSFRNGEIQIIVDEAAARLFSPEFIQLIETFKLTIGSKARDADAMLRDASMVVENELKNLPLTLLSPSVVHLKDALKGRPAVVVSAGPSLSQCVHLLPDYTGRAAVIATAPVLRVLSAYDVTPDLVGILDYGTSNYEVLQDVYHTEDVPLAFLEAVYPDVIRDYQGDLVSVLHTHGPVRKWLSCHLPRRDHWPVGRNVGSFCLDLAIYLSADPIILVGQDLGFPDFTSHSEGVIGRKKLQDTTAVNDPVWRESVGGGKVLSNVTLCSYLEEINKAVADNPDRTFINTSPAGARITGTIEMPLALALETHCFKEPEAGISLRAALQQPGDNLDCLWDELTGLDQELENLAVVIDKAMEFEDEILELIQIAESPNHERLAHLIRVHDQYTTKAKAFWNVFEPLKIYLAAPLATLAGGLRPDHPSGDWKDEIIRGVRKCRNVLEPALKAARRLRGRLETAREELSGAGIIHAGENHTILDPLTTASHLSRLGRSRLAWPYYRKALALEPENPEIMTGAAKVCIKRERMTLAEELLRGVLETRPGYQPALEAFGEIENAISDWTRRSEQAEQEGDWITALLLARKRIAAAPGNADARRIEAWALAARSEKLESSDSKLAAEIRAGNDRQLETVEHEHPAGR